MELLRSLSIGKRLALAFGAVLLLLALTGGTGALQITRVNGNAEDLATNWMPSVGELGELKAAINQVRRLSLRAALETDASDRDRTLRQHDEALSRLVAEHRTRYEALISSPEEKSGYEAFSRQWDRREAVDEALRRRARRLRFLDSMDDARKRRIRRRSRDLELEDFQHPAIEKLVAGRGWRAFTASADRCGVRLRAQRDRLRLQRGG